MSNIELLVGNTTTKGQGSMTIVALYKKNPETKHQVVTHAVKDAKSGVLSLGLVDIKNSSSANRPGQWIKTRVEIPEGSFLEFQLMMTKGIRAQMAAFVIRARQDGPLYRIAIDLPVDQHSTESKGYVEGRFDILSPKEIKRLGVNCHKDLDIYNPSDLTSLVTVERIEKEIRSLAVIAKAKPIAKAGATSGNKTVLKVRRLRRIGTT